MVTTLLCRVPPSVDSGWQTMATIGCTGTSALGRSTTTSSGPAGPSSSRQAVSPGATGNEGLHGTMIPSPPLTCARPMLYLSLAVICSVLVSVLLKVAGRRQLDVSQMVTWNYLVAATLTAVVRSRRWMRCARRMRRGCHCWRWRWRWCCRRSSWCWAARWRWPASSAATAQRLSLLLSCGGFLFFGQTATPWKLAGALGLLAMVAISLRPRGPTVASSPGAWGWLLGVWAGFAVVDVLLKQVALSGTVDGGGAGQLQRGLRADACVAAVAAFQWLQPAGLAQPRRGALLGLLNGGNILSMCRRTRRCRTARLPCSPA